MSSILGSAAGALGRAILTLATDDSEFSAGIKGAHEKALALQGTFLKVGGALTAIGAGFVVAAKSAIDLGDEMAKASQKTGIMVEDLSGLKYAGDLSDVEFPKLQQALRNFAKTIGDAGEGSKKATELFEGFGIKVLDQDGKLRPMKDLLMEVADKLAGIEDPTARANAAMDLFGSKVGLDMIPMLSGGSAGLKAMQDEAAALGKVMSTETALASEQVNDSLTRLSGAFTGLVNTMVSSGLLDHFANFVNWLAQTIGKLNEEHPLITQVIGALGLLAGAIGPVIMALGMMLPAITAIIGVLSGPVGIIVAIAAVVAVLVAWAAKNEAVREAVAKIWDQIKEKFEKVLNAIAEVIEKVTAQYQKIWEEWGDEISPFLEALWKVIDKIFGAALKGLGEILSGALDILTGIIKVFGALFTHDWDMLGSGLKDIWSGVWNIIKGILEVPLATIRGTLSAFADVIKTLWTAFTNQVKETWNNLWTAIKNAVEAPLNWVKDKVKWFSDTVTGTFKGIYDTVVGHSIVPDMMNGIASQFARLNTEVLPKVQGSTDAIGKEFSDLAGGINNPETGLGSIGTAFDGLLGKVKSIVPDFGGLIDGLGGKFKSLWSGDFLGGFGKIGEAFSGMLSSITDIAGKIGDAVTSIVSGIGDMFTGGLASFAGGAVGGLVGGLLAGMGGKDNEIEENTRYCRIALVGEAGVIDILHKHGEMFWLLRTTMFEAAAACAGALDGVLWSIFGKVWDTRDAVVRMEGVLGSVLAKLEDIESLVSNLKSAGQASTAAFAGGGLIPAFAGAGPSLNVNIQTIDSSNMERAVRTRIAPELERLYRNTRTR